MKIKELIEELQKQDPEREVILQKDPEGNGHSPFSSCYTGSYVPDSTYSGSPYLEELTEALKKMGYTEEDVCKPGEDGAVAALFLVPVN